MNDGTFGASGLCFPIFCYFCLLLLLLQLEQIHLPHFCTKLNSKSLPGSVPDPLRFLLILHLLHIIFIQNLHCLIDIQNCTICNVICGALEALGNDLQAPVVRARQNFLDHKIQSLEERNHSAWHLHTESLRDVDH